MLWFTVAGELLTNTKKQSSKPPEKKTRFVKAGAPEIVKGAVMLRELARNAQQT
ncbi:hypothetical protein MNBD_NITROSPINAE03-1879 [hydrothermal vent metagenome]|uniref:Uncharacterized protein n=1 Tax=hydrothermal vent metagenome TaxID=652676 RepID=A0A3B1C9M5_9ZZZZ